MFIWPVFTFLIGIVDSCIPTQQVETTTTSTTTTSTTTTSTTTSPYVCPVCKEIYAVTSCPKDTATDYCLTAAQVGGVTYTLGQMSDGYGDSNTCSIDLACPSGILPVYTRSGGSTSSLGNLVATCSELTGVWQFKQTTNDPITNAVCRGS
ncbi:unnamed protein product [Caenorhabditis angaria]|uniref:C6 domain-containing protein n=1 Tax=Caenorhabditis angaria TaxID=860376 RepID=A0A9P1N408_9PELO|nr:unnamed protein product [Caenorhabditis angaria]